MSPYLYLSGTIIFTVLGQLLVKYAAPAIQPLPNSWTSLISFVLKALTNVYFLSALILAFTASICWLLTINKLPLSYAYPFMSLSFILVLIFSHLIFKENISLARILGVLIIIVGLFFVSRS